MSAPVETERGNPKIDRAAFISQFRRGKIAPPTARNFDTAAWRAALDTGVDPEDAAFLRAGLWFAEALQARWAAIQAVDLANISVGALSRHLAGVANLMQLRTDAMIVKATLAADPKTLPSGSVAHLKLGDDADQAATADMIRTSGVEALGKLAGYIRTVVADGKGNGGLEPAAVGRALKLCEDIYLLEFLWGHVAWCGWSMIQTHDGLRFVRPDPDPLGTSFVVAEYRRELLLAEFQHVYGMEWQAPDSRLPPAWRVETRKRDDRWVFSAKPLLPGRGPLPDGYVLGEVLKGTELEPYLDDPLPNLATPDISLRDLVTAWQLLSLAAEGLRNHLFKTRPSCQPLALAPTVRVTELEALLEPLGWKLSKRKAVITFLTYERQSLDGLWSKPFLPTGGGRVTPVLTPLICPNLLRTAELWLAEAAGETFFTRRGAESEARLQADVAKSLAQRPWRGLARVLQAAWEPKIDGVRRDIDLVVRVGATVFIGELKLKKYPASAAEIGRHAREFEHAAEQLDIRLAWLIHRKALLAEKTGFDGDPAILAIRGVIVSGTAFGSGGRAGGYPVIDRDALTFFFENDAFLVSAKARRENGYVGEALTPSLAVILVEHDPEAAFLAYVENPLHVRFYETGLVTGTRSNRLHLTGETLEWPEPSIDGARLRPDDSEAQAESLRVGWRHHQSEAADHLRAYRASGMRGEADARDVE
jgi:hypothetical protein